MQHHCVTKLIRDWSLLLKCNVLPEFYRGHIVLVCLETILIIEIHQFVSILCLNHKYCEELMEKIFRVTPF
jgi:hypothetical protein